MPTMLRFQLTRRRTCNSQLLSLRIFVICIGSTFHGLVAKCRGIGNEHACTSKLHFSSFLSSLSSILFFLPFCLFWLPVFLFAFLPLYSFSRLPFLAFALLTYAAVLACFRHFSLLAAFASARLLTLHLSACCFDVCSLVLALFFHGFV